MGQGYSTNVDQNLSNPIIYLASNQHLLKASMGLSIFRGGYSHVLSKEPRKLLLIAKSKFQSDVAQAPLGPKGFNFATSKFDSKLSCVVADGRTIVEAEISH